MKIKILGFWCLFLLLTACQQQIRYEEPVAADEELLGLLNVKEQGGVLNMGIGGNDDSDMYYYEGDYEDNYEDDMEEIVATSTSQSSITSQSTPSSPQKLPQKLIKTANLSCEVEDYQQTAKQVKQLTNQWNAYISDEQQINRRHRISNKFTIRVPKIQFDSLLLDLEKLALRIDKKHVNIQDISEEFFDLKSRLNTAKKVEQRYYEILKDAKKVEEILKVEKELKGLREDIESKEGRLNFLNDQVNYSSIRLSIYQKINLPESAYQRPSFFGRIGGAFQAGWYSLLDFTIRLIYIWPFVLLSIFSFIWLIRLLKKRRKKT